MIKTIAYYPENAVNFRQGMQRRWSGYSDRVESFNSEKSMQLRTDGVLIYHVIHTTVFIHRPDDDKGRVDITAKSVRSQSSGNSV